MLKIIAFILNEIIKILDIHIRINKNAITNNINIINIMNNIIY